jgi:hypothetical protein
LEKYLGKLLLLPGEKRKEKYRGGRIDEYFCERIFEFDGSHSLYDSFFPWVEIIVILIGASKFHSTMFIQCIVLVNPLASCVNKE